jgi:predicted ATPase/class 3 adenylate cyclase
VRGDLPTGTVTFLFTDIEGSTRLLHALGPDAYAAALAEHRRVLRDAFDANGGVEVDTQGDAFFAAFPTAEGAAGAAAAANAALSSGPISVRMGLHTGTPTVTPEGYVGVDVHRGARVAALAHGGQILVSPAAAALLDGERLLDLGTHRLKDFDGATRLSQLGAGDFPSLRTPGSVELPNPATRFIGRERELFEAVSIVYDRDPRMLTIVGPGGTGKTRFAIELARLLADEANGATVFVPLAPIAEGALVLQALADRLGAATSDPEAIAAALRERRTHVVVDNLEHLLPAAARPLAEVVQAAPTLRVLATSREPLRIQGEIELDLPPLEDEDAATLFVERAQAVRPGVERTDTVDELCRRLDHLPLALELAAARTKLLAPEALLDRLGDRLDLLAGTRDADERHATLRATIAWSYDLLEEVERGLFARLSVFRSGCTLESAESVCGAGLETLASLLDKSLLRRRTGRLDEERFWMLETIREFAAERLLESPETDLTRRRHAERMLELARSAHLTEEDDEPFELEIVLAEREEMRAALDWASESDLELALELLVALENFWNTQAPDEAVQRLDRLLPAADAIPPLLRARALRVRGGALHISGHVDACDPSYDESLAVYRALAHERGIASITHRLAGSALERGEIESARALARESLESSRERFPFIDTPNVALLGYLQLSTGDVEGGTELIRRSERMAAELRWDWWRAAQLDELASLALARGDADEALRDGAEALRLIRQDEDRNRSLWPLTILARAALGQGERRRAGVLWGAVEAESQRAPSRAWERSRAERGGLLLDEVDAEFLAGVKDGRQLDVWDAVAVALGEDQTVP